MKNFTLTTLAIGLAFSSCGFSMETVTHNERLVEYYADQTTAPVVITIGAYESLEEYFAQREASLPIQTADRNERLEELGSLSSAAETNTVLISRNEALDAYFADRELMAAARNSENQNILASQSKTDKASSTGLIDGIIKFFRDHTRSSEIKSSQRAEP